MMGLFRRTLLIAVFAAAGVGAGSGRGLEEVAVTGAAPTRK